MLQTVGIQHLAQSFQQVAELEDQQTLMEQAVALAAEVDTINGLAAAEIIQHNLHHKVTMVEAIQLLTEAAEAAEQQHLEEIVRQAFLEMEAQVHHLQLLEH
jgi:hypothetical protein